jgi:hypothetical protein
MSSIDLSSCDSEMGLTVKITDSLDVSQFKHQGQDTDVKVDVSGMNPQKLSFSGDDVFNSMSKIRNPQVISKSFGIIREVLNSPLMINELLHLDRISNMPWITKLIDFVTLYKYQHVYDIKNIDNILDNFNGSLVYKKTPTCCAKMVSVIVMFFTLCLPMLYGYWITLLPHTPTSAGTDNIYFLIFMEVINSDPFLVWITFIYFHLGSKNATLTSSIKYLQMSRMDNIDINTITIKDYHYINGLAAKVRALQNINLVALQARQFENRRKWFKYMVIGCIWSGILWILYGVWLSINVFTPCIQKSYMGTFVLFFVIFITSIVRFPIPVFVFMNFIYECEIIMQDIREFYAMHYGNASIKETSRLIKYNLVKRKSVATNWQYVFIPMFIIPMICIIFAAASFFSKDVSILNEWFFAIYFPHYTLIGFGAFEMASSVGTNSYDIRQAIKADWTSGDLVFVEDEKEVHNYLDYLSDCYSGFAMFGIVITKGLRTTIFGLYATIIVWLSENVSH